MVKDDVSEPEQMRKLFIGGLDYRTTDEGLKEYFEQFGEIVDVVVMKDPKTKRSRGFGFVAFARAYMVDEAQKQRPHKIDGRAVDTKRAVPRDEINKPESGVTVKKLFVGGLKEEITEDDLKEEFSQFGEVVNVSIPLEKDSQKKRGFAFVEFADYDAVDKACIKKEITVCNKRVDVKKALSKSDMQMQQQRGRSGGMNRAGGSGGPWGGGGGGGGGGRNDSNWGNNQGSGGGWGDTRGNWGNQGNYGASSGPSGPGSYNQGGYGNQGPWQSGPPNNQSWGGNQGNQGWGSQPSGYGGQGGNWNQGPSDFGNNYGQSYGGGPMRNQNYGQTNRSTPYNAGVTTSTSTGAPMGYNNGAYGSGGGMGGPGGMGPGPRRY